MKKRNWIISALLRAVWVLPPTSDATPEDDFDKGYAAHEAGDFKQAFKYLSLATEQGNALAQYSLGVMYSRGESVAQNGKQAVQYYRLAAEQGYALAQYNLGLMYGKGQGVAKNHQIAYQWVLLAATQDRKDSEHFKEFLKTLEEIFTPEQRAAAQKAAAKWQKAFDAR